MVAEEDFYGEEFLLFRGSCIYQDVSTDSQIPGLAHAVYEAPQVNQGLYLQTDRRSPICTRTVGTFFPVFCGVDR